MTEGRHYWEVEIVQCTFLCDLFVGAVRPGLDHEKCHKHTANSYHIYGCDGSRSGNGCNSGKDEKGETQEGVGFGFKGR